MSDLMIYVGIGTLVIAVILGVVTCLRKLSGRSDPWNR